MPVFGDLGFRVAALALVVGLPVIGFVIRRKRRIAAARREEIKRLLALASEEAAWAEQEATISDCAAPVSSSQLHLCAVCFSPTTTRCARCKAVRYCSGKCQIIHWRQGHKGECHPPLGSFENDEGSNFNRDGNYAASFEVERMEYDKPCRITHEEPESNYSVHSHQKLPGKNEDAKGDHSSDGNFRCSDVFVSEDDSLHGIDTSDERHFGPCSDKLETALSVKRMEQTKPPSPEFTTMVEPVNTSSLSVPMGDPKFRATNSSGLTTNCSDVSSLDEFASYSTFWDGSLDSGKAIKYARTVSAKSVYDRASNGYVLDSRPSLRFSFNMSGNLPPDLPSHVSKIPDNAYPGASGTSKSIDGSNLPEKEPINASRGGCSTLCSSKQANSVNKDTSNDSYVMMSGPSLSCSSSVHPSCVGKHSVAADAYKANSLLSSGSERSHRVSRNIIDTSQSVSEETGSSCYASNYPSSTGIKGPSPQAIRSEQVDSVADNSGFPHDVSNVSPNAAVDLKTSMLKVVDHLRASKSSKRYSFGVGSEGFGKASQKMLFPYELFVKLYNWNKMELRPCGLTNCGNSCYANVVLQCLAFTPPLTAYLLQGLHSKSCVKKDWCFTCEFERLILKSKEGGSPLSPIRILSQIQKMGSDLASGREEDAHEFLRYVIDSMQSICLQEAGVSKSSPLEEETTLMGLTFGGYFRSKIRCMRCHGKSARDERMMDISAEVEGDIETLEQALRQFTSTEILDGDNKYQCERCKSREKAKKKFTILEAPNVLTIALKRFQSGNFRKLNKSIQFPEILDLAPYMRGASDKSPIYRLYGVVVHLDILNSTFSGHYVCYVRNVQNKWFKIDDSSVKAVERERVLREGAYMLFYSRCSPRAPGSIRNSIISREMINKVKNSEGISSRVGKMTTTRSRDLRSTHSANSSDNAHSDKLRLLRLPNILEVDSLSDNSSIFSHSDEVSSTTDSNRESTSTDDFSDYIFGDNPIYGWSSYWRYSSDSDTSSSSSSSSSPLYPKRSPLSNSQRHASNHSDMLSVHSDNVQSTMDLDPWAKMLSEASRPHDLGGGGSSGASFFLDSDRSKPGRKLAHSTHSREADLDRLGWPNSFANRKSGSYVSKSFRRRAAD
ncbi:hypothetical protein Nepgr_002083 [Nepenthes gracilis]|uniref:ubiquitinyl hydrolase 1 n=1 Tax=Nepenthes gracilis TaxID=150966 RepID=A0AAD3RXJ1_NEPGR|nr:hypothetical protein Nepgr_002083 [Nepenthes gracilis]